MKYITTTLYQDEIQKIKSYLSKKAELQKTKGKYEILRAKLENSLIIVYNTGRMLYWDTQEARKTILDFFDQHSKYVENNIYVGADEAGKGEKIGPLIVSAVAANKEQITYYRTIGVIDSKLVPQKKLGNLANEIEKHSISYVTNTILPERFNEEYARYKKEGKTLNNLLTDLYLKTISEILSKIDKKEVIVTVDRFDGLEIIDRIKNKVGRIELYYNAERRTEVAAASIIAKHSWNQWVKSIQKKYKELLKQKIENALSNPEATKIYKIPYLKKDK